MKAYLFRKIYSDKETLGVFNMWEGKELKFQCFTLELPWKENENGVSCIETGHYKAVPRTTGRYAGTNLAYHVTELDGSEVEGRKHILIHPGNYYTDILGCILPGSQFGFINDDHVYDIGNSTNTVRAMKTMADEFDLHVHGTYVDNYVPGDKIELFKTLSTKVSLNLRSSPYGELITTLLKDTTVLPIGDPEGDWQKVEVYPYTGYVHKNYTK